MSTTAPFECLPTHILSREQLTMRQWKAKKRKEFREIKKAFNSFRDGCAFTPVHHKIHDLEETIDAMWEELKNWT